MLLLFCERVQFWSRAYCTYVNIVLFPINQIVDILYASDNLKYLGQPLLLFHLHPYLLVLQQALWNIFLFLILNPLPLLVKSINFCIAYKIKIMKLQRPLDLWLFTFKTFYGKVTTSIYATSSRIKINR